MYTVILQNHSTMTSFQKFHPLFMSLLNAGKIGVCKWIEGGTTIDTAAPGLPELVNDKEEWRAVIVLLEDDETMSVMERSDRNPFDFSAGGVSDVPGENPVPLIRLTQMLGGVPKPEIRFEPRTVKTGANAYKINYSPVTDEGADEAYRLLREKYRFDGRLPSSVLLIAARRMSDENPIPSSKGYKESQSSDFWKKNHYPGNCRFAVYDYENNGPVQREADEFKFWMTVQLLASTGCTPDVFQAYRLYKLDVRFDRERMSDTFQQTVTRLRLANLSIENEIGQSDQSPKNIEPTLPNYRMKVPVDLKMPDKKVFKIGREIFGLMGKGVSRELNLWEERKKAAHQAFEHEIVIMRRTLDRTADGTRGLWVFNDEAVSPLNRYQREDMQAETNALYEKIVERQGNIPEIGSISENRSLEEVSQEIRALIRRRADRKSVWTAVGVFFGLMLLADLPGVPGLLLQGKGSWTSLGAAVLCEGAIAAVTAFVVLLIQKLQLMRKIRRYNELIDETVSRLTQNADEYSRYMSDILSHTRGASYMHLAARKTNSSQNAYYDQYKHIKAIHLFLSRIKVWSRAFHMSLDFHVADNESSFSVRTDSDPLTNLLYSFDDANLHPVPINQSGAFIESPFAFVDQLMITREELYNGNEQ